MTHQTEFPMGTVALFDVKELYHLLDAEKMVVVGLDGKPFDVTAGHLRSCLRALGEKNLNMCVPLDIDALLTELAK